MDSFCPWFCVGWTTVLGNVRYRIEVDTLASSLRCFRMNNGGLKRLHLVPKKGYAASSKNCHRMRACHPLASPVRSRLSLVLPPLSVSRANNIQNQLPTFCGVRIHFTPPVTYFGTPSLPSHLRAWKTRIRATKSRRQQRRSGFKDWRSFCL